ncbi:hypothetical protein Tco_1135725 [Tanacetum coccineum]
MKRGYAGDIVPLLPAMLAGAAVDQGESSAQPAEPYHTPVDPTLPLPHSPLPSPPYPSPPPHSPLLSPPHPSPSPHSPPPSPHQSPPYSPPHYSPPRSYEAPLPEGNTSRSAEDSMQLKELMDIVLGKDSGKVIKKKDTEGVRESMKEKSIDFITPTKASGEAQEEDISLHFMEAATIVQMVDFSGSLQRTGSAKVDSGTSSKRGQREGKAPMVEKDIQATDKTKEQIRQEAAGLEEAIRLQAQMDEENGGKDIEKKNFYVEQARQAKNNCTNGIKKSGANTLEEMYDRSTLGVDLKDLLIHLLVMDAIWSCHFTENNYWRCLPNDAKDELLDGTMDEVCYQLLKMIRKQAGIRK